MRKVIVAFDEQTEEHIPLEDTETTGEFNQDYVPADKNQIVEHMIDSLNGLCRKYKYAVLKDHDIISEDVYEFYVEYHFNGKELGVITVRVDKKNGKWEARTYLSVKRAARLPVTNFCQFVTDLKLKVQSLHINMTEHVQ